MEVYKCIMVSLYYAFFLFLSSPFCSALCFVVPYVIFLSSYFFFSRMHVSYFVSVFANSIKKQFTCKWGSLEQFSIMCCKAKTKPVTYQLCYSANLKPQLNQNQSNCIITFDVQLKTALLYMNTVCIYM